MHTASNIHPLDLELSSPLVFTLHASTLEKRVTQNPPAAQPSSHPGLPSIAMVSCLLLDAASFLLHTRHFLPIWELIWTLKSTKFENRGFTNFSHLYQVSTKNILSENHFQRQDFVILLLSLTTKYLHTFFSLCYPIPIPNARLKIKDVKIQYLLLNTHMVVTHSRMLAYIMLFV
jgi:hypothetical protein